MLTIITATLNAGAFLERALASVAAQNASLQHIVVDGGSTDDTADICRSAELEFITVPGCSIYEAWNIGFAAAQGDAIMFLNADDELTPDAVATVTATFAASPEAELVAGRAVMLDASGHRTFLVAAPSGELDVPQLATGVPAINAIAFRRSIFAQYGPFDTAYRVAGDRAFLLRLALSPRPPRIARTDTTLYCYHVHAGSLTLHRNLTQRQRIARDHIALARTLLERDLPPSASLWLKHVQRRERVVAALYSVSAGHWSDAWAFLSGHPS
jgi:glycosyltransferase involved in cell wall biosynthesis